MGSLDLEHLKETMVEVLKNFGVKRAALFGSVARGDEGEGSDIDLLIEFDGSRNLLDLVRLKIALEEHLGRSVDVVTYGSLHPLLKEKILIEQQVIL